VFVHYFFLSPPFRLSSRSRPEGVISKQATETTASEWGTGNGHGENDALRTGWQESNEQAATIAHARENIPSHA
jgi:hypothetical protein